MLDDYDEYENEGEELGGGIDAMDYRKCEKCGGYHNKDESNLYFNKEHRNEHEHLCNKCARELNKNLREVAEEVKPYHYEIFGKEVEKTEANRIGWGYKIGNEIVVLEGFAMVFGEEVELV